MYWYYDRMKTMFKIIIYSTIKMQTVSNTIEDVYYYSQMIRRMNSLQIII
jgi:tetrahydromethanopterin S-methyltransferase subunit F